MISSERQQKLLNFRYSYQGVGRNLSVWSTLNTNLDRAVSIEIMDDEDDNGNTLGRIEGFPRYSNGQQEFYVCVLTNLSDTVDGGNAVPRVIGTTIAELVGRKVINSFYSSYAPWLSNDARDLYERFLRSQSNLMVQNPSETYNGYIVTEKSS